MLAMIYNSLLDRMPVFDFGIGCSYYCTVFNTVLITGLVTIPCFGKNYPLRLMQDKVTQQLANRFGI